MNRDGTTDTTQPTPAERRGPLPNLDPVALEAGLRDFYRSHQQRLLGLRDLLLRRLKFAASDEEPTPIGLRISDCDCLDLLMLVALRLNHCDEQLAKLGTR